MFWEILNRIIGIKNGIIGTGLPRAQAVFWEEKLPGAICSRMRETLR